MAGRGRSPGFRMSDEHRVKIQNSNILNSLIKHAEGKMDMSSSQVNAATVLLKKILPDLSSVQLTGSEKDPVRLKVTLGGDDIGDDDSRD